MFDLKKGPINIITHFIDKSRVNTHYAYTQGSDRVQDFDRGRVWKITRLAEAEFKLGFEILAEAEAEYKVKP